MSLPRLALLALPLALGLPLLTGACGAPVAMTAVSYAADGVSLVDSGKSTTDHLASMVSKKDCALWRVFRSQKVCREREGDKDPYQVNYDTAERQPSEDGVAYAPPLRPAADAPPTAWNATSYKPAAAPGPSQPTAELAAVAETAPPPPPAPPKASAPKSAKKKTKLHAHAKAVKKPSPGQVASVP
ncbi:hypothetical protein BH10PSE6_BH10PSE6_02780 [soil metagenome]